MPKKYQPVGVGMSPTTTDLGKYVREQRIRLDLRQTDLVIPKLVPQSVVSAIEVGIRQYLNEKQIQGLSGILGCDPEELRKRVPEKTSQKTKSELGIMIRSRRQELGMSLEDFAGQLGITYLKANYLETRTTPKIQYYRVDGLAKALRLDVSAFAKFVGREKKPAVGKLGEIVRRRRKELAMSLEMVASKLGVTRQFVEMIESGRVKLIKDNDRITRLAEVLDLPPESLIAVRSKRRLKSKKVTPNPLSGFLVKRRIELGLTQKAVAGMAETNTDRICCIEMGKIRPTQELLGKLEMALLCKIPPEIISNTKPLKPKEGKGPRNHVERKSKLGEFVTNRRLELGLTQVVLAEMAGIHKHVICGVEVGRYRPGRKVIMKLSEALGCEIPDKFIQKKNSKSDHLERELFIKVSGGVLDNLDRIRELLGRGSINGIVKMAVDELRVGLEREAEIVSTQDVAKTCP